MSLTKVLQIEKRYGKRLSEVFADLIEAKYSIMQMSEELGFSRISINNMLNYLGIRHLVTTDYPKRAEVCRQTGKSTAKIIVDFRGYQDSVSGHCECYGLKKSTVYHWISQGIAPSEALNRACRGR